MNHEQFHDRKPSLNRTALSATVHCLAGCSMGEVLGMILGTALGWGNGSTIAVSIILAFISGYLMTLIPLLKAQLGFNTALSLALASDTISITIMEIVDNAVMLIIPGAMSAGLDQSLFWGSLLFSFILAGIVAFPANIWLISRGKGHALLPGHHSTPSGSSTESSGPMEHHDHRHDSGHCANSAFCGR